MKKGLLLYNENDAKINKWFIERLIEVAKQNGIQLTFSVFGEDLLKDDSRLEGLDFCINRTRFSFVGEYLEKRKIRCFNNAKTVKAANDKWETYLLLKELGISAMPTVLFQKEQKIKFDFPFVVKARNGHGGSEVFWADSISDLEKQKFSNKDGYIAQQPVSDLGVDVRVYVLGNRTIAGVKRTSKTDFRSNFSLGGQVELFTPTAEQQEIIDKLQSVLEADYAGFDFILHNGKWVLNEIEDAVGARMLYSLCDCDIAEQFIKHIKNSI